jgi:2-polyprenyl-3-methyl-5-hydroxy-6-metoxy-1,4-benzoquinol methylase
MSSMDWDVEGVELDPAMLKICRRRGLRVSPGTLEGQQYPDSSFDAITAKHVIEHVHEPVGFLRECERLLKPGGTLVILTPNLQSLGHRIFARAWLGLDVPRHLVLFTPAALRRAAEQAGLHVVRLWTTARPSGFNWRVSSEIRRDGRSRYLTETTMTQRLVERASDTAVRLALSWNRMAGDELALVATKSPGGIGD